MLGFSIAFAIAYTALPTARYRDRLHRALVERFQAENVSEDTEPDLKRARERSAKVSEGFFYVAMWLRELPQPLRAEVSRTSADLFSEASDPVEAPALYRWFRWNGDKKGSVLVSLLVPLVVMWLVSVWPDMSSGWFLLVAAVGQLWVGVHAALGWHMVRRYRQRFQETLRRVIASAEGEGSSWETLSHLD